MSVSCQCKNILLSNVIFIFVRKSLKMKKTLLSVVLLMFSCFSMSQSYKEAKKDSVKTKCVVADGDISYHNYSHDNDTVVSDSLILNEVVVKSSRVVPGTERSVYVSVG